MTPTQTTARPTVILATLASIAIALAVCATAATVIVASDVTRERELVQAHGSASGVSLEAARAELSQMPSLRALVDSLAAPLAPFERADSVTIARLTAQWDTAMRPQRAVFATAPELRPSSERPATPMSVLLSVARAVRGDSAIDHEALASVLADSSSDWLASWRRFARSEPLPPFWGYREGLVGVTSMFDLPLRQYSGARYLMLLNEVVGRVALQRGDVAAAEARGRENVAASRHYLDSPVLADFAFGRSIALAGTRLLTAAAEARGASAVLAQARALEAMTQSGGMATQALTRAAERDAASPAGQLAYELFDDEKLPFAVRVEILYAAISGACNHTREVLFGFDPSREARLAALAARHAQHPVFGEALRLIPPTARRVREAPASLLSPDVWPTAGLLDRLLPDGVAQRAVLCQQGL